MNTSASACIARRRIRIAALVFTLAACAVSARADGAACLQDAYGGSLGCATTDDVVQSITIQNVTNPCLFPGDKITFDALVEVSSPDIVRRDVGIYLGVDPLESIDMDCSVSTVAPGVSGEDADSCGDLSVDEQTSFPVSGVTALCEDTDDDGVLDVTVCTAWKTGSASDDCAGAGDAVPGSFSACSCASVNTTLDVPTCESDADCNYDLSVCLDNVCDPDNASADEFGCTFPPLAGSCDDGFFCNGADTCLNGTCVHAGDPCATGDVCGDVCNESEGNCFVDAGTVCRPSTGVCDEEEVCTGTSAACPAPIDCVGMVCRSSTGICDPAELCTAESADCPADTLSPSTRVCRGSAGVCDVAERCTGSTGTCPGDSLQPSTTVCRSSGGVCDVAETCTGASVSCPANTYLASSSVCRTASGVCDVAESCTGSSATCPANALRTTSTTCRAASGVCDLAEVCSGLSSSCPANQFTTSGTTCRSANGVCDAAEACTGTSGTCPTNVFTPSGTTCRSANGVCDAAEACTGTSGTCPTNVFTPSGTTCRSANGICDAAEACTGTSGTCPTNVFTPSGTTCRSANGVCDAAEACTGTSGTCPTNVFTPSGTTCRSSTGTCDAAEACTGTSGTCPVNIVSPTGTVCRSASGACDQAEVCNGTAGTCPSDTMQPSGTTCRTANGVCDLTEVCSGTSGACPANGFQPSGTTCRTSSGQCDVAEQCTGTSGACAADAGQPNNTPCNDALFCTINDVCTGGVCTGNPNPCDDDQSCSLDSCDELADTCVHTSCDFPVPNGDVICRSPGFWSTHSGHETKGNGRRPTTNVGQALLDVAGPLEVCGEVLSTSASSSSPFLAIGDLTSILQGLCVRVQGESQRQLFRQLTAAALNCAASGHTCDEIFEGRFEITFTACSDLCAGGSASPDAPSIGECIEQLDAFNNGLTLIDGESALGTCEQQPDITCGGEFGDCPDFLGADQRCLPFEGSCGFNDLCNTDIGFCPPRSPASSSGACNEARHDACTIDMCE